MLTLLRLQLFPELVFQAEEESGEGPLFLLIVGGRFVQERAHHTFVTISPSISPFPSPPYPPSLTLSPFLIPFLLQMEVSLSNGEEGVDERLSMNTTRASLPKEDLTEEEGGKKGREVHPEPNRPQEGLLVETFRQKCMFLPTKEKHVQ